MSKLKRILIADTTLRDGAQTIGVNFSIEGKSKVAAQLVRLGVDIIELGTPVAAPKELEACRRISQDLKEVDVVLAAFARARERDIELAFEGVGKHSKGQVNLLTSVSDIHLSSKFKKSQSEMLKCFSDMIRHATSVGFQRILVYLEDGTRTEFGYIVELVSAFVEAGADIISIPDTVGFVNHPEKYGEIFSRLIGEVKLPKRVQLSAHTHNDKGLAVACALSALRHGASIVECTINGLGERAGNASLGALMLNLNSPDAGKYFSERYPFETGIRLEEYYRTAQLVGELGGMGIHYNEPVVGSAVVTTAAGIHQDGILKNRRTYLCYDPEAFGVDVEGKLITFNMQSGIKGITKVLSDMGVPVDRPQAEKVYEHVILLAQQKVPSNEDIRAIAMDVLEDGEHVVDLEVCRAESGSQPCKAEVVLLDHRSGKKLRGRGFGDGPFAAFMEITCELLGVEARILDYHDSAIGEGRDSQMQAFVRCKIGEEEFVGRGVSTDIVLAGCRAFMKCLNRHLQAENR